MEKKDLFVLTADIRMQKVIEVALKLHHKIGIRNIDYIVERHPQHDSGSYRDGCNFLASQKESFNYGLIIFDYEGCGADTATDSKTPLEIEEELNHNLDEVWLSRAKAIVINPELEKLLWSTSPHFKEILRWQEEQSGELLEWLTNNNFDLDDLQKPIRPKEALYAIMKKSRLPRSTSVYKQIVEKVSFRRCQEPAFIRMITYLQEWFPAN
ncbi:MAG: hypothetical protein KAS17_00255 [Victivallaceae bacterium]|nr:hypothetical protein [Victivallaceae bacterium]